MKISKVQFASSGNIAKLNNNKKTEITEYCNHCGGVLKGSEEWVTCLMCGREKGHICAGCIHNPKDKLAPNSS